MRYREDLVSVIIPCYNVEKYIAETLDCMLTQTHTDFEIICVDDGSTDRTIDILRDYENKDTRIKHISQRNRYAGVARNNGIKHSIGKYVVFFDGDDLCAANFLEELYKIIRLHSADIGICDSYTFDNVTGELKMPGYILNKKVLRRFSNRGFFNRDDIPKKIFNVGFSGVCNKIFDRNFLERENIEFQDTKRDNDEYFMLMAMALARRISWVNKRLSTYRVNQPHSLQGYGTAAIDTEDFMRSLKAVKEGLLKRGLWDTLKSSFQNQLIGMYVGRIEGQQSIENFIRMYEFVKNHVFVEFDIHCMNPQDVFTNFKEWNFIRTMDWKQYIFSRLKLYQISNGEKWIFPYSALGHATHIGIYGAGEVGKAYMKQLANNKRYIVEGWFDYDYKKLCSSGMAVTNPQEICKLQGTIQKMIIAIEDSNIASEVKEIIKNSGFQESDIIWDI